MLIYPKGNSCEFLSLYLDVADPEVQPHGWSRCAKVSLTVVSLVDEQKYNVEGEMSHTFVAHEPDWGFKQFIKLSEINDASKGYVVDDTLVIRCAVRV